jgi:hypothetical protein
MHGAMALSAVAVEKRVAVQTNGAMLKCIFSPISLNRLQVANHSIIIRRIQ